MPKRSPTSTLVIPPDLMRKARLKAIEKGTSVSAVVREFLEEWVKDCPEESEEEDSE